MVKQLQLLDDDNKKLQGQTQQFKLHGREEYPNLCDRFVSHARTVHDPHFEAGVLKIQERHEASMHVLKKQEVSGLLLTTAGTERIGRLYHL